MPAGIIVPAFPRRSPPRLLTTAAYGGLRSTPDCRTRRTYLHLSYSYASPFGPALLVTQDPLRTSSVHCSSLPDHLDCGRKLQALDLDFAESGSARPSG